MDIYLKLDKQTGNVILLTLMENGVVSSFLLEKGYKPMKMKVEQTPDKKNGKNVKDKADNATLTNDNKDTNGSSRSNQTSSLEGS